MDGRATIVQPQLMFNLSSSYVTPLNCTIEAPPKFCNVAADGPMLLELHSLPDSQAPYTNTIGVDCSAVDTPGIADYSLEQVSTISESSKEDLDKKSDAGSREIWESESVSGLEDEEYDAFGEDGVKMKLQVLAAMVGVQSDEPGLVLAQVVRALKEMEKQIENFHD